MSRPRDPKSPTPPKRGPGRPKTSPLDRQAQYRESKRRQRAGKLHLETFPDTRTHAALTFLAEKRGKPVRALLDEAIDQFLARNKRALPPELLPPKE